MERQVQSQQMATSSWIGKDGKTSPIPADGHIKLEKLSDSAQRGRKATEPSQVKLKTSGPGALAQLSLAPLWSHKSRVTCIALMGRVSQAQGRISGKGWSLGNLGCQMGRVKEKKFMRPPLEDPECQAWGLDLILRWGGRGQCF